MCLGRVKGTRVATSAAGQTEETAGCSEERAEWTAGGWGDRAGTGIGGDGARRGEGGGGTRWEDGCTCARHARVLSRRIPFSGSFPTIVEDALAGAEEGEGEPRFGTGNSRHPVFPRREGGGSWSPESDRSPVEDLL